MDQINTPLKNIHNTNYTNDGFVICKGLISVDLCNNIVASFKKEILPYKGALLRSTSANKEKHQFSESGMMTNPILQIQDLDSSRFPKFQHLAIKALGSESVQNTINGLLNATPILIQSAFYHSSVGTAPHEDSHYFDSKDGRMLGCWIALEDIDEKAGRFYVYPKTHHLNKMKDETGELAKLYKDYINCSLEIIRSYKNQKKNPALKDFKTRMKVIRKMLRLLEIEPYSPNFKKGDAIIFSSKLFHGSYDPSIENKSSRSSLIGHYIPRGVPVLRYQEKIEALNTYKKYDLLIQKSQSY